MLGQHRSITGTYVGNMPARLLTMANLRTVVIKLYGMKRWIAVAIMLVVAVPLAILLGKLSAEECISSLFDLVAHAASCSSTFKDDDPVLVQDDRTGTKIRSFKYQFFNRVFIAFRSNNTVGVHISCVSQVLLIISLAITVIVFLQLVTSLVFIYIWRLHFPRPTPNGSSTAETVEEDSGTSSRFLQDCIPYNHKVLVQATNGFKDEIGRGSSGEVYKGILVHEGRSRPVAIKKMQMSHRNVDLKFEGEIRRIGMVRHKNVLQLVGYSDFTTEDDKPLLMVTPLHESLAKHLEDGSLPWPARFEIAKGVAEGLAYLHDGLQQKLVHHDIKPGNILFDTETHQAYIADFGSARLMPSEERDPKVGTDTFAGTTGYMDPHFRNKKIRTTKVDVYSFGVVLFVLIAGREIQKDNVSALVHRAIKTDIINRDYLRPDAADYNQIIQTLNIARLCTKYEPDLRPTMSQVAMMLRGDIPVSRLAQELSRAASCISTFTQSTFSTFQRSFNTRANSQLNA